MTAGRRTLPAPDYALAAGQGRRLRRLFAAEQVSTQLVHAVSRPYEQFTEEE
jgi:hypothetical protein